MSRSLAIVLITLLASVQVRAQSTSLPELWKIQAKPTGTIDAWFVNDNATRGMAYNPTTGNLLVVSRTGGLKIVKINASTGDSVGTLDIVGISGGTFIASLIDVTPDGRIFVSNLTTNAVTSPFKIYTWENESSAPEVAYTGAPNNLALRFGDSFRVDWTDGAMDVYAGGSNNPNLAKFTWTGESLVLSNVFNYGPVNNTTMRAVRSMAPIAGEDSLWINEFGYTLKKISTMTGQIGTIVPANLYPTAEAIGTDYVEINNRKLLAVFPSSLVASGQSAHILNLNIGSEVASTLAGVNSNGNASGAPLFDAANNRLFLLATNNHIASYDITSLVNATDYVNIQFRLNTATIRDTVSSGDLVQIRGVINDQEQVNYLGQVFNWGASSVQLDHVSGDYWSRTIRMRRGDILRYKIYTAKQDGAGGWTEHSGGGLESSDEQIFTVPSDAGSEYVAPVVYFNRVMPFEPKTDSVALFFRVNVGAQSAIGSVNADSKVGLRGTPSVLRNPEDWSSTNVYLTRELDIDGNLNLFYSGVHYVPVSFAGVPFTYKFVIESDGLTTWEDGNDRSAVVSQSDSTYNTVFFSNRRPPERAVIEANLLFKVDVGALEELGLFNRSLGDRVFIPGVFNGWNTSEAGTATATFTESQDAWLTTLNYRGEVGTVLTYKYFISWNPDRYNPSNPNHIPLLREYVGWEEPGIVGGGERAHILNEFGTQYVADDPVTQRGYFNGVPRHGVIRRTRSGSDLMTVTFRVDMTSALSHHIPFDPLTDSLYLAPDTPIWALTQGVSSVSYGEFGDGYNSLDRWTFTKVEGLVNVYELAFPMKLPTENNIGFVLMYRKPDGTIVRNGGGFDAGRRYYRYVTPLDPTDKSNVIWPDAYTLSDIVWKPENLDYEQPPCYCEVVEPEPEPEPGDPLFTVGAGVTDIDGNTYKTVIIGDQEWMAENLRTTRFANGDPITKLEDLSGWSSVIDPAWTHYDDNPDFETPYGKLYNWYAISDARNACPVGWKTPSDEDWKQLEMALGMTLEQANATDWRYDSNVGGLMKVVGTDYWNEPNGGASNRSGMSLYPGGSVSSFGHTMGRMADLWSSTAASDDRAWHRSIPSDGPHINRDQNRIKASLLSVRCVKSTTMELPNPALVSWKHVPWEVNPPPVIGNNQGLAVDKRGRVWVLPHEHSFTLPSESADSQPVRVSAIHVYEANGEPASFSPIWYAPMFGDTIGVRTNYGRGLRYDSIRDRMFISMGSVLYRADAKTGEIDRKRLVHPNSGSGDIHIGTVSIDEAGRVYVPAIRASLMPNVSVLDQELNSIDEIQIPQDAAGISRTLVIYPDALTLLVPRSISGWVYRLQRVSPSASWSQATLDTVLVGAQIESMEYEPNSDRLWFSAGSLFLPAGGTFAPYTQTWVGMNPETLAMESTISWDVSHAGHSSGRPRAIAFSPKGRIAYVGMYNSPAFAVQRFTMDGGLPQDEYSSEEVSASSDTWTLPVRATTQTGLAATAYLGVSPSATDGLDSLDIPAPPTPPGNHITLFTNHPEWNSPLGPRVGTDIRASVDLSAVPTSWELTLSSSGATSGTLLLDRPEGLNWPMVVLSGSDRWLSRSGDLSLPFSFVSAGQQVFTVQVGDTTAPELQPGAWFEGPAIFDASATHPLDWQASDANHVQAVELDVSHDDGATWSGVYAGTATEFDWTPSADIVFNESTRFRLTATDRAGNAVSHTTLSPVSVMAPRQAVGFPQGWSLRGSAFSPTDESASVMDQAFRFRWTGTDYQRVNHVQTGGAMWIGAAEAGTDTLVGTVAGQGQVLQLPAGWNMVTAPLLRTVYRDSVMVTHGTHGRMFTLPQAIDSMWVTTPLAYVNGAYAAADRFTPFIGYWLGVSAPSVSLHLPIHAYTTSVSKESTNDEPMIRLKLVDGSAEHVLALTKTHAVPAPPTAPNASRIGLLGPASALGSVYLQAKADPQTESAWPLVIGGEARTVELSWTDQDFAGLTAVLELPNRRYDLTRANTITLRTDEAAQIVTGPVSTSTERSEEAPLRTELHAAYPNPFNPSTQIRFTLDAGRQTRVAVYDLLGREVAVLVNGAMPAGRHHVTFDASGLASGVYLVRLEAGGEVFTRRVTLLK